jgi:hypothetical protein
MFDQHKKHTTTHKTFTYYKEPASERQALADVSNKQAGSVVATNNHHGPAPKNAATTPSKCARLAIGFDRGLHGFQLLTSPLTSLKPTPPNNNNNYIHIRAGWPPPSRPCARSSRARSASRSPSSRACCLAVRLRGALSALPACGQQPGFFVHLWGIHTQICLYIAFFNTHQSAHASRSPSPSCRAQRVPRMPAHSAAGAPPLPAVPRGVAIR